MAKTDEYQEDDSGVFSLDMSCHGGRVQHMEEPISQNAETCIQKLLTLLADRTELEAQLLHEVREHRQGKACQRDCAALAQFLRGKGYKIKEHGPGTDNPCKKKGRFCLETISHNYLTCSGSSTHTCQEELIVEAFFKEEFQIANPTSSYKLLLSALPAQFVGSAKKLSVIINLISQAVTEAFQANNMTLPPWRRATATLSKWGLTEGEEPSCEDRTTGYRNKPVAKRDAKEQNSDSDSAVSKAQRGVGDGPVRANRVSLLARGLADMIVPQKRKSEATINKEKLKRAISWDFSGLQPIKVIHRAR